MMQKKTCNKCHEEKNVEKFHLNKKNKDGRIGTCAECRSRINRSSPSSVSDRKKRAEYQRDWTNKNRAKKSNENREWRARNKHKTYAHNKIYKALKTGKMEKKDCSVCGSSENIVAHHSDYTKPYQITWLCAFHHVQIHKTEIDKFEQEDQP